MNRMTMTPFPRLALGLVVTLISGVARAEEAPSAPATSPLPPSTAQPAAPSLAPAPATPPAGFVPAPFYAPPPPAPLFGDRQYRSPGLAVALSLQPLPIDFGNLYAENLGWGIAYSAVEVSLLAPMMWMTGQHMNHGSNDDRGWSGMETGAMMGLGSTYVVVKLVSGVHAGHAARTFNREGGFTSTAAVLPTVGGAMFAWTGRL